MKFLYDVVPLSGISLQSRKWVILGVVYERRPCKQRHPFFSDSLVYSHTRGKTRPLSIREALIRVRKKHVFSHRNKDKFPLWYRYESLGA